MERSHLGGPSVYDSDYDPDELLARYDGYIVALARKKVPRNVIPLDQLGEEIDELAQKIRIKIWQVSQKQHISSPKSYISSIAYTEAVDMVRRYKPTLPLPIDENGEIRQGHPIVSYGAQDPLDRLEPEEIATELTIRIAAKILTLPPRQLHALLCSLRDQVEDLLPLIEILRDHGVDVEKMS